MRARITLGFAVLSPPASTGFFHHRGSVFGRGRREYAIAKGGGKRSDRFVIHLSAHYPRVFEVMRGLLGAVVAPPPPFPPPPPLPPLATTIYNVVTKSKKNEELALLALLAIPVFCLVGSLVFCLRNRQRWAEHTSGKKDDEHINGLREYPMPSEYCELRPGIYEVGVVLRPRPACSARQRVRPVRSAGFSSQPIRSRVDRRVGSGLISCSGVVFVVF